MVGAIHCGSMPQKTGSGTALELKVFEKAKELWRGLGMYICRRKSTLLLVYLQYLLSLWLYHLARAALNSSIELAARNKRSWAGDVLTAATKFPFDCPPLPDQPTYVHIMRKNIYRGMEVLVEKC